MRNDSNDIKRTQFYSILYDAFDTIQFRKIFFFLFVPKKVLLVVHRLKASTMSN